MPDPEPLIQHVTFDLAGNAEGRAFYRSVLGTLGHEEEVDREGRAAFGADGAFGVYEHAGEYYKRSHVAFAAPSVEAVDRFHEAAVGAGGRSLDAPRRRPEFDPRFYSAYVEDPAGNVVEVLYRSPVPFED